MDDVILIIRLFLFGVFILAGIGKLLDPAGSAKAMREFGAPDSAAETLGYALPFAEIIFGISLLFTSYAWFGALGATLLLLTFVGGMIVQIRQGRAPDCHCFGQIHSEPVGAKSLIRNVVLLALALFLVSRGMNGQGSRIDDGGRDLLTFILLLSVVILLVIAVSYLIRISAHQQKMDERVEILEALSAGDIPKVRQEAGDPHDGLPIGALFPDFTLGDRTGKPVSLASLLSRQRSIFFFFVGPTCVPCQALMHEIEEWYKDFGNTVDFVLVTTGTVEENQAKLGVPEGITVLFQKDREVAESVGAKWTPTAMLVRRDGRVASRMAAGDRAVRDLASRVRAADHTDPHLHINNGHGHGKLKIGKPASAFNVRDIKGREITSQNLAGNETLAIFWSQTCPHCVAMMGEIKAWDAEKTAADANLVVFSEGNVEDHEKLGLRSPVVIDPGYKTAAELGMFGTPSAVLIDENGVIASEAAIGASNIWSLIGRKPADN